jgi:hypothetical protein
MLSSVALPPAPDREVSGTDDHHGAEHSDERAAERAADKGIDHVVHLLTSI